MDEKIREHLTWEHYWALAAFIKFARSENKITDATHNNLEYSLSWLRPKDSPVDKKLNQ